MVDDSEPAFSLPEPVSAVSCNTSQASSSQGGHTTASKPSIETSGGLDKNKVFHCSDGPVQKILDGIKEAVTVNKDSLI